MFFDGFLMAASSPRSRSSPACAARRRSPTKRYESCALQLADPALAYLAERENIRTVFTTDRRDFSLIRLKRNRALKIIPEVE